MVLLSGSSFAPTLFEPAPGRAPNSHFDSSMDFAMAANCTNDERTWLSATNNEMGMEEGVMERAKMMACMAQLTLENIEVIEGNR